MRRWSVYLAVLAAAAALVVQTNLRGGDDPLPPDVANLWVSIDGDADPCTRVVDATLYDSTKSCTSFDAACEAASTNDVIGIKNATYPRQNIICSETNLTFVGESKSGVIINDSASDCRDEFGQASIICVDIDDVEFQNITLDANDEDGPAPGSKIYGNDVTYRNVDIIGDYPDISLGDASGCSGSTCGARFTWDGGEFSEPGATPRSCQEGHGEPIWVHGQPDVTISGITFNAQDVIVGAGPNCGGDNVPHLEFIRLDTPSNFTLRNSRFLPGSDAGSGYIFSGTCCPTNTRIIGNYFADNTGTTWAQHSTGGISLIAYNTFSGNDGASGTGSAQWIGNLGPQGQGTCNANRIKNVWGGSGSCGTDTFVGATDLQVDANTGKISAGSPAVDNGETTCTDAPTDFEGTVRPQGAACDAGGDEL